MQDNYIKIYSSPFNFTIISPIDVSLIKIYFKQLLVNCLFYTVISGFLMQMEDNPSISSVIVNVGNSTLNQNQIHALCHQHCAGSSNASGHEMRERPSQLHVWLSGLAFVTVIGLCAVVGILVMRCLKKNVYNRFITFFVSVGVGSLSGSAVFHLLPQAFELVADHDHSHGRSTNSVADEHAYLMKSFAAIIGIYIFFFSDKVIKIILEQRKRITKTTAATTTSSAQSNHHGHQHTANEHKQRENGLTDNSATETLLRNKSGSDRENSQKATAEPSVIRITAEEKQMHIMEHNGKSDVADHSITQQTHALCIHDHPHDYKEGDSVIATVAWMIIFGDGLHNFIDGITIGTSFSESLLSGISVSVAVLCEEFPHELGDVAILVNAGMTLKQALVYNLLSALSCYVGFVIGVLLGNITETFASYTFGFAGGMFLYISLGCMMPEMKNAMEKALGVSLGKGLEVLALQASGVITGLGCMFLMARYGDNIKF